MARAASLSRPVVEPGLPGTGQAARATGRPPGLRGRGSDALDLAILRAWTGEETPRLGVDPRNSPERIARLLRVSPATVRRHLTQWRTRGFLRGYDVIPHPGLLGGRLAARLLEFPNPIALERAIAALGLVDGMIQVMPARDTLLVAYMVDSDAQARRRQAQLGAVEAVKAVGPEMALEFEPCSRRMSRADWRLAQALRRRPEARLAELAGEVGQSVRTTSRRYDELVDESALVFDPILDFGRFHQTLAGMVTTVTPPERKEEVAAEVRSLYPDAIRTWGGEPAGLKGHATTIHFWVTAPTSAQLDELAARVAHLGGVTDVFLWYARSTIPIHGWLEERIEAAANAAGPAR
jgi:DNA-binding Lrp family transcriptional regulator